MSLMQALVSELDHEAKTTRKVLEAVPADRLDYKPHTKSMSLGDLAWHLANIPDFVARAIVHDDVDFTQLGRAPKADTLAGILAAFDASVGKAREVLAGLNDASALATWTGRVAGKVVFQMPRVGLVRNILLNHACHHRGQLSVYLRLLDAKVPSIYGPSADENPFAG